MIYKIKDYTYWNKLKKPQECESVAQSNDIVCVIEDVVFLCQRKKKCNNIICFNLTERESINHIKSMFKFALILKERYNIEYIRVEGNTKRYRFLEKIFEKNEVIKDITISDRNVYYCRLKQSTIDKLNILIGDSNDKIKEKIKTNRK